MYRNKHKGVFIAIEGLDGSGASTQVDRIKQYFKSQKKPAYFTAEPTTDIIGGIIRACLSGEWKMDNPEALQLMFASDRANHLTKEIIPQLEKGRAVITDRYFLSSIAYGSLDITDTEWLSQINSQFILPDLTILLKVSVDVCVKRIKKARTGIELFDNKNKLNKVWQTYLSISKKYPNIVIIDGEKEEDEVFNDIKEILEKRW